MDPHVSLCEETRRCCKAAVRLTTRNPGRKPLHTRPSCLCTQASVDNEAGRRVGGSAARREQGGGQRERVRCRFRRRARRAVDRQRGAARGLRQGFGARARELLHAGVRLVRELRGRRRLGPDLSTVGPSPTGVWAVTVGSGARSVASHDEDLCCCALTHWRLLFFIF